MAGWSALSDFLRQAGPSVQLTWSELDRIVGGLPPSAGKYRAWWSGDRPHVRAWRSAGYTFTNLVLAQEVTFVASGHTTPTEPAPHEVRIDDLRNAAVGTPAAEPRADLLLVTCVKSKLNVPAAAQDLYISALFRKERAYAERQGVPWFILSAEHGLVAPDEWLSPYERYLPDTPSSFRTAWGVWVVERLELLAGSLDGRVVEVHAGSTYVDSIRQPLTAKGAALLEPLAGLTQARRLAWYGKEVSVVNEAHTEGPRLVRQLLNQEAAIPPSDFLGLRGAGLKVPGLYSWWVDAGGAAQLSVGLGLPVSEGLIYAGLAGATRWPSGKRSANTLWLRISGMHLNGNHQFSTFRRTLGAILANAEHRESIDEDALTGWMLEHLKIIAVPCEDADTLGRLEMDVLKAIDPPLNLGGMGSTAVRRRLKELRRPYR